MVLSCVFWRFVCFGLSCIVVPCRSAPISARRRFAASSLATIRTRSAGRTTLQRSELTCLALTSPAATISAVGSERSGAVSFLDGRNQPPRAANCNFWFPTTWSGSLECPWAVLSDPRRAFGTPWWFSDGSRMGAWNPPSPRFFRGRKWARRASIQRPPGRSKKAPGI